jgi:hypothetical protein
MARYSFSLRDGLLPSARPDGRSFPRAAALLDGTGAAWWLMSNPSETHRQWTGWRVEVADDHGRTVVVLPFALILSACRRPQGLLNPRTRAWG